MRTEEEGEERISVIDSIQVISLQVLLEIVLDNGRLSHSGVLRSSGWEVGARPKGEDILVSVVLESVWVDVNKPVVVSQN